MSNKKFVLNRQGIRELMRSEAMKAIIDEKASAAVQRLGPGYKSSGKLGKNRVSSKVYAESYRAKRENAKNNTILKAVK